MAEAPLGTIVVVDDTDATRYVVARILRQACFTVHEAATGQDALRLARQKPDLVVLDVNLPDMSGYEVCQRIKADPALTSTPVLHLSASFVESESRSEGLEGGADGYLTYPLEPRELLATVEALLRARRAEQAVRAERELLRVTLASIGDGVVATDAAGRVTFINPVAQGLTGWPEPEALGRPIAEVFRLVSESSGDPVETPVDAVLRSGEQAAMANHTLLVARDGSRRPVDDTAAPIRAEGALVGVVLVFRDVTDRRRLEAELQRRSDDLVERDRRKDEFLAMLAHELRNPLAPISNTLQALKMRLAYDPVFAEAGGVMERQVKHMARLIDDLMDVSRITRGKFELRRERVELAAVVARAVEAVRPALDERGHRLELALPIEPLALEADSARLEQVFANLLSNSAKYTPPGGLVRLEAIREGDEAVVRVRDNGIGIRPEAIANIFDLFQQSDRLPGRVSEGLGIGLSLVRSLAEMHCGRVSATSAGPGQGSEFTVRLPALAAGIAGPAPEAATAPAGRPLRVLITDDNVDSAESLARLLRLVGHQVRTAYDGHQALEVAREFRPEVVFLDLALPRGMDGYELARRLRGAGLGTVLLVAMTGYGSLDDIERTRAAGLDHHLVKPADLAAVCRLLAGRGER